VSGTEYEGVDEGGTDEWSGPTQEEWQQQQAWTQQVTPFLSELANALQQPQQEQYGQQQQYQADPAQDQFDPWDPNSMQGYINQGIQQGIQQAMEPYSGILGIVASREGEQLAHNELAKIEQELGAFDKDTAFLVASGLIDQGHDPAAALRKAAEFSKQMESRIREDERTKYNNEIKTISSGRGDLPAGQGSAEQFTPPPGLGGSEKYAAAIERALANGHPSMPVG